MLENTSFSSKTSTNQPIDSSRESFRQCLRLADKLIIEGKFDLAKIQLEEAKKIDSRNPFIVAFEERISIFEKGGVPLFKKTTSGIHGGTVENRLKSPTIKNVGELEPTTREAIEQKLRQQIEAEYKTRYTQEIRKAEEQAAKILEKEKEKFELHRQSLNVKYEHLLAEARKQIEIEYQQKLDEEILKAEERLQQQHQAEVAFIENEMKTQLTNQYEVEIQTLQARSKANQADVVAKEQHLLEEREQILKEQFNQKLLEAVRKTEELFREQNLQQLQIERERVEQELRKEYEAQLIAERDTLRQQFDELRNNLEQSSLERLQEFNKELDRRVQEQIFILKQIEEERFEQNRLSMRQEIEIELQQKYEIQIADERERIKKEAEALIESEKKRLEEEYNELIQAQNEQIQKMRSELRGEMEQALLTRLEKVAEEYDNKMELLGAKLPETKEDRLAFYKNKMMQCYDAGAPSVDNAKMLMQLKELLELTFDEHLAVESDVRLDLYAQSVERKIRVGELNSQNLEALDKIKQQFNITADEALHLETHILSIFERITTKGKLLIVDDDLMLLQSLSDMMSTCDYQVITAPDIKTALDKLQSIRVDLILSDIKFGPNELDGFQFFKSVQEQPHLRNIPFLFMSSLQDGVIIRSGVQLGVDDYITKPMDAELLIATIEGKLKRYQNLKRN
ncbi:MAG: response regulator [Bacteroidota bacterium]|nr:response regulator [Bacteroidota bacterium]